MSDTNTGWEPMQAILDAEDQVLGAILAAPVIDDLAVTAEDFYRPANAAVFTAAKALHDRGDPIDPASVVGQLTRTEDLAKVGGHGRVYQLYASLVTATNVGYHAQVVAEDARRRRLHELGSFVRQLASTPGDVDDKIAAARDRLAMVESGGAQADVRPVGETLHETMDRLDADADPGLTTGIADLDEVLGPLTPGQLVVVAGRPGSGKSVFALTLARNVAQSVGPEGFVGMFSLEMSSDEVNHRLLAQTGIPLRSLAPGHLDVDGWAKASRALPTVAELALHVTDAPDVGLADLRRYCRRELRLKLLIVDYLQLMRTDRAENRQNEVAALSRGLKLLAKATGIPVVVLAQLNRAAEHRQSKRPLLSDLRESGAIEQDADVVLLLHRDELYDPLQRAGEMDIIVAKQRQGAAGMDVPVGFQGAFSRVVDLAQRWQARTA